MCLFRLQDIPGLDLVVEKGTSLCITLFYSHSLSSETLSASDSFLAVDTLHSPFRSISSMVRVGTLLSSESALMVKDLSFLIDFKFMLSPPMFDISSNKVRNQENAISCYVCADMLK